MWVKADIDRVAVSAWSVDAGDDQCAGLPGRVHLLWHARRSDRGQPPTSHRFLWRLLADAACLPSAYPFGLRSVIDAGQAGHAGWTHKRVTEVSLGTKRPQIGLPQTGFDGCSNWRRCWAIGEFQHNVLGTIE